MLFPFIKVNFEAVVFGDLVCLVVKNPPANAGDLRIQFNPWVRMVPWRRKWQPIPVFLPGESHGQRSLVGYSPWGHTESDTTKASLLSTATEQKKHKTTGANVFSMMNINSIILILNISAFNPSTETFVCDFFFFHH